LRLATRRLRTWVLGTQTRGFPAEPVADFRRARAVASAERDAITGPRTLEHAADAPAVAPPPEARAARKLGLRAALTGLVLLTVIVTAILIHLTWFYNARRNVADVVGQLNRQIVGSVQHEVRGTLNDAWSVQEAVQSIFFQEAIKPTEEPSANSSSSPCCGLIRRSRGSPSAFPTGVLRRASKPATTRSTWSRRS
jgi:hypothetical protein